MTGAASAADMAPRYAKAPPPAPVAVFNWTGCYIGGHVGGGWSENRQITLLNQNFAVNYGDYATGQGFNNDGSGWVGGGQVGCNYQSGAFVFGVEGSYAAADIKGSHFNPLIGAGDDRFTTKVDGIASVVGRAGIASNNWLFYVKGGWAGANAKLSVIDNVGPVGGAASVSQWHNGWTVGGGVEYGLTPNWIIGIEGNYYQFESKTYELGNPAAALAYTWASKPDHVATVVGRLSYKFGWGGPVVAKY
jgi:outer membrane immunogenic protein